jgi:hypothetical protein
MSINQPGGDRQRSPEQPGRRQPGYPNYGYDYGYQLPGHCPYGGSPYYSRSDTDLYSLANQLGISTNTIIKYNPGLSYTSTIRSGQVICLPENY